MDNEAQRRGTEEIDQKPAKVGLAGVAALAAALPGPASAEIRTAQYGAPFCEKLASFRTLIEAMLARDEAAAAELDDCVFFKPGVKVEVLKDYADFGTGYHVVQIRRREWCFRGRLHPQQRPRGRAMK